MSSPPLASAAGRHLLGVGLLVLVALCASASRSPAPIASPAPATDQPALPLAADGVYFGVWQAGVPDDWEQLTAFETLVQKRAAIVMFWRDWAARGDLDPAWLDAIVERGAVPLISWTPADWLSEEASRTRYTLAAINAGAFDEYVRGWARQLAAHEGPVFLRWAHEMNGDWYPWGRQPAAYVAAWRRLHAIFQAEGASNVLWVWSPNVARTPAMAFEPYYPGDEVVDWVGLDGYNYGDQVWLWFPQVFEQSYEHMLALTAKPLMIAEVGSSEALPQQAAVGDTKARWIEGALSRDLPRRFPRVRALVWFNENKRGVEKNGHDWRVDSSPEALAAFIEAIAAPYYRSAWP